MRALFAGLLLIGAGSAQAVQTYSLSLNGSGTWSPDSFACASLGINPCVTQPITWLGSVAITTDSAADGIYTGADLLSIAVNSNVVPGELDFSVDGFPGFGSRPLHHDASSVTIAGGHVAAIHLNATVDNDITVSMDNLTATYTLNPFHHGGPATATAQLAPIAAPVPEPATFANLLAGLLALLITRGNPRSSAQRLRAGLRHG